MLMPTVEGVDPLWLQINPSWAQDIEDFSTQNNVDILASLQSFGNFFAVDQTMYNEAELFWPDKEVFWDMDVEAEEGAATENQVRYPIIAPIQSSSSRGPHQINIEAIRLMLVCFCSTLEESLRLLQVGFESLFQTLDDIVSSKMVRSTSNVWHESGCYSSPVFSLTR